jgi:hypothetical protein
MARGCSDAQCTARFSAGSFGSSFSSFDSSVLVGSFFEFPLFLAKALYFVAEPCMFLLEFPHLTVVLPLPRRSGTSSLF